MNLPLIEYVQVDISDIKSRDVEAIIKASEKKYGPIEMVICCAAISKPAMFISSELD
jgi:NAD(P)-dependent dehydrogenase (short-subunit alcohol dehydrogenase family)